MDALTKQTYPTLPGVYLMRDAAGLVLYVGKAKNLRNRLARRQGLNPEDSARFREDPRFEWVDEVVQELFDPHITPTTPGIPSPGPANPRPHRAPRCDSQPPPPKKKKRRWTRRQ